MDVKMAVQLGLEYVAALFASPKIDNLGLEEVQFDEASGEWRVTVGFSRPWDRLEEPMGLHEAISVATVRPRTRVVRQMKVVRIRDGDGRVLGVRNYEKAA